MNSNYKPRRLWAVSLAAMAAIVAPALIAQANAQDVSPEGGPADVIWEGVTFAVDVITTPKQVKRYTDPACKTAKPVCGVVVYANAGGYTVSSVLVDAKSSQPANDLIHPACSSVKKRLTADVKLNTYDVFVLPADCLYKLKITISGGRKKSRDIFLTPGCQVQTYTDGTTTKNKWHKKIKWLAGAQPAGVPDTPMDAQGNKCSVS